MYQLVFMSIIPFASPPPFLNRQKKKDNRRMSNQCSKLQILDSIRHVLNSIVYLMRKQIFEVKIRRKKIKIHLHLIQLKLQLLI